jgi:hypothetical protein
MVKLVLVAMPVTQILESERHRALRELTEDTTPPQERVAEETALEAEFTNAIVATR